MLFAARTGVKLVDDLSDVMVELEGRLPSLRADATARRILPHLISHPTVNSRFLKDRLNITDAVAARALRQLAEHGILVERSGRRRDRVWIQPDIVAILDLYAQQLTRR